MRLNGGIIGRANEPTSTYAFGVWGWAEYQAKILASKFPRFFAGWDLTGIFNRNPVYTGLSFATTAQDNNATGIFVKPDGSKLYAVGITNDSIFQYSFGTAWDVSTLSYDSISFSLASEDTNPRTVFFKPDGTKMYVVGDSGDDVNEYDLSTAWDITSASYLQAFSVAGQETTPTDVFFKPDGSKMYIVGINNDAINEYNLSTAWDVSTASFLQAFSVAAQDTLPRSVLFTNNGYTMLMTGNSDRVYEYSLSSPWDVSTASYNYDASLATGLTTGTGMALGSNDSILYIIDNNNDVISQYLLKTPGSVKTAGYDGTFFNINTEEGVATSIAFKPDGTKMYIIGTAGDDVNEYDLSTAWDITSASYLQAFLDYGQETVPHGLFFKPDGSKMYVCGFTGDDVNEYDLSTAWDVSTASFVQVFAPGITNPTGLAFKPDGTKMYVTSNGYQVRQHSLSTAWDISTTSFDLSYDARPDLSTINLQDIEISLDGTKLFVIDVFGSVLQYSLFTPWDLSTINYDNVIFSTVSQAATAATGLTFKYGDGTKMYVLDNFTNNVFEYVLT
jgi:6-phosphogluconolactonase (cycloisomerase 2 family)